VSKRRGSKPSIRSWAVANWRALRRRRLVDLVEAEGVEMLLALRLAVNIEDHNLRLMLLRQKSVCSNLGKRALNCLNRRSQKEVQSEGRRLEATVLRVIKTVPMQVLNHTLPGIGYDNDDFEISFGSKNSISRARSASGGGSCPLLQASRGFWRTK